jgi:hypothetical protein
VRFLDPNLPIVIPKIEEHVAARHIGRRLLPRPIDPAMADIAR